MSTGYRKFWSAIPDKAMHPRRVSMLEALRWIGEPLSALDLVDLSDGDLDMWEAAHHIAALEALGVLERAPIEPRSDQKRNDDFDVLYGLTSEGGE